ncbi:PREDICTED: uncharacterized protein LOC106315203 [Brassica oleracea var. oleracea]|nr:PREDICTED: uncharacterized protein LOC106315203 [Brassica oleracea var. oleracea]
MGTSSTPDIDMVIEETRRTPFTNRIASVRLHHIGKLKFPEYAGSTDPKAHVRAFRLAISRAHLTDDEKEAGYCRFFTENLTGAALEWFTGLEENSIDNFTQVVSTFLKQYTVFIETKVNEADLWNLKQAPYEPLRTYINKFREIKAKISLPNEVVALAALKNNVSFSSKFREELAVQTALKEQYSANKNNAIKKPATPKEQATKGQHSYSINNSPQKSSTYDLSKYCAFHERKGHSTEECRATLRNQNENKKTNEEAGEEEEEPVTPKSNRKAKVPMNKRGMEIEHESPSSPPPTLKKRVDMISWGQNSNTTDEFKSQTEGKIRLEISVAIHKIEKPDEDTPPPQVTKYNPNKRPPSPKFLNFKQKNKMTKIRELLEKPIQSQSVWGQRHYRPAPIKRWNLPAHNEGKKWIDFIYGGSKFCNSVNSIKAYQRRAKNNVGIREPLAGPDHEITFKENETADLDKPHDDTLVIRIDVGGCELSRVMIDTRSSADVLFYEVFKKMGFTKALVKQERTPLTGFAGETTYSLGSIELAVIAGEVRK